jgi:hypothetical protein
MFHLSRGTIEHRNCLIFLTSPRNRSQEADGSSPFSFTELLARPASTPRIFAISASHRSRYAISMRGQEPDRTDCVHAGGR